MDDDKFKELTTPPLGFYSIEFLQSSFCSTSKHCQFVCGACLFSPENTETFSEWLQQLKQVKITI